MYLTIFVIHWKSGWVCSDPGRSLSSTARDIVRTTDIILYSISFAAFVNFLSGFQAFQELTSGLLSLFFLSKNVGLFQILPYWLLGNLDSLHCIPSFVFFLNALASYGVNANQNHSELPELLLSCKYCVLLWGSAKSLKSPNKPKVYDKSTSY